MRTPTYAPTRNASLIPFNGAGLCTGQLRISVSIFNVITRVPGETNSQVIARE